MGRERRTRQSNREYQERVRRAKYQEERRENEYFSVLPKQQDGNYQRQNDRRQSATAVRSNNHRQSEIAAVRSNNRRQSKTVATGSNNRRQSNSAAVRSNNRRQSDSVTVRSNSRRQPDSVAVRSNSRRQPDSVTVRSNNRRQSEIAVTRQGQRRRQSETTRRKEAGRWEQPQVKPYFCDYTLIFIAIFLVMFGLLMLYTASIYTNSYFVKQCGISLLGVVGMLVFSHIDYHRYATKPMLLLIGFGSVLAVLLVLSPIGITLNGARRWISIGPISLQPAEIFKIAVILINAFLITKFSRKMSDWRVLVLFLVLTLGEFLFIYKVTQNLSSAIIVAMITVLMVFIAYPGYKLFFGIGAAGIALVAAYVYYVVHMSGSGGGFRSDRIIAWLAPEKLADQSKVFQTTQALYSIGSGGLWGKGLGSGTQKMILPEAMNDMIFAIICEELGMIGAFLVLVMFAILLYRLMFIAKNSKDLLGGMIAAGIFSHFMLQVVLNIGVVTNLLPSTGVTLPFISYGGTALVLLMAEVGIALNVSRQIDFEPPKLVRKRVKKRKY